MLINTLAPQGEVVGSNNTVGKKFSFCNSLLLCVPYQVDNVHTNEIKQVARIRYHLTAYLMFLDLFC